MLRAYTRCLGLIPNSSFTSSMWILHFLQRCKKLRRSVKEHVEAVWQEVGRLKKVRSIKEIFFPEWFANTDVVTKKNGK